MAKYTTEVRTICETLAGYDESKGYQSVQEIIENSRESIFSFNYPIFDAEYKPVLETKILKHYYGREIASETFGRWQLWLDARLNEIMPYYNKLYESELLEFNPLYDIDLTTDYNKEGENSGTENISIDTDTSDSVTKTGRKTDTGAITDEGAFSSTRTDNLSKRTQDSGTETDSGSVVPKNTKREYFSDTPQGGVTGVENDNYLTTYKKTVDDGTGSTNSNTKTFGKIVTETDTGTVGTTGTDNNTRTLNTATDTSEHSSETGTYDSTHEKAHTINTTEDYLQHVIGKTGGVSYSKLLEEYRNTFLNIDLRIINNLSDLFFGLW